MGLNIKKPSTEAAIRELAAETGETLTDAVEQAVRERLRRVRQEKGSETVESFLAAIRPLQEALARERRAKGDTRTAQDLMDELYDEHGLPK
jgi:antitoxin VapB